MRPSPLKAMVAAVGAHGRPRLPKSPQNPSRPSGLKLDDARAFAGRRLIASACSEAGFDSDDLYAWASTTDDAQQGCPLPRRIARALADTLRPALVAEGHERVVVPVEGERATWTDRNTGETTTTTREAQMYTTDEVADLMRVHVETIRRQARDPESDLGKIAVKAGKLVLFPRHRIHDFLGLVL